MKARVAFLFALLLLTAGALAFRLPHLDNRPMHADESVHAVKFDTLWKTGVYEYDPNEFHGPTLYYAALPVVKARGRIDFADTQEADYRLVTVIFGAAILLLYGLLSDGIGRRAALAAAALTAISPAFVFYSRYYIQEMLLVFFTLGAMGCAWRYHVGRKIGWLIGLGLCSGLMIATKETAVFSFAAAGLALGVMRLAARRNPDESKSETDEARQAGAWHAKTIGILLLAALPVAALFLSGFGTHGRGAFDYLRSYTPWMHRAGGATQHVEPPYYYLQLLLWTHRTSRAPIWSEALIVGLAVAGGVTAFVRRPSVPEMRPGLLRFVTLYTLFLMLLYSAIPYKTPWCVLSFLNGMLILAGAGAVVVVQLLPGKVLKAAAVFALLGGGWQLERQAVLTRDAASADPNNPYVYAQTVPDILPFYKRIQGVMQAAPQKNETIVSVLWPDDYYWPLPWYLRDYKNIGYWHGPSPDTKTPIVVASPVYEDALSQQLSDTHIMIGYTGLRPGGVLFETWVRQDIWTAYVTAYRATHGEDDEP